MTKPNSLHLTISLNVLYHLGKNLYNNVPAVLAEMVANAWDADASRVDVSVDRLSDEIVIRDDGHGMTRRDVDDRYLHVGYDRRRDEDAETPEGRHVMGRKGIGKLAAFGIANVVEVYTAYDHGEGRIEKTAFRMSVEGIQEAIEEERRQRQKNLEREQPEGMLTADYQPEDLVEEQGEDAVDFDRGTRIVLRDLDKRLVRTEEHLRRRVARRFSIIGPQFGFEVYVDGERVTAADRDYYGKLEFLWTLGSNSSVIKKAGKVRKVTKLRDTVEVEGGEKFEVEGWVGTVEKPSDIPDINTAVPVFAYGKLVEENILDEINESRIFAEYVIGEVYADFLDHDDLPDLVTSNRQSVRDDPRYVGLRDFMERQFNRIGSKWTDLRNSRGEERALSIPPVRKWYDRLEPVQKPFARKLFQRIERLPGINQRSRIELYKSSLLAFERMALDDALDRISGLESEKEFEMLGQLFTSIDAFEAAQYYQITKARLQVVEELTQVTSAKGKQRVLKEHVFDHLWLLDPTWGEPSGEMGEGSVQRELLDQTEQEVSGRIAMKYRLASGQHVVVDLRDYSTKIDYKKEYGRLTKLIEELKEVLKTNEARNADSVELVCIAGEVKPDKVHQESYRGQGIRFIQYDELIENARKLFEAYIERQRHVSDIVATIDSLEDIVRTEGQSKIAVAN